MSIRQTLLANGRKRITGPLVQLPGIGIVASDLQYSPDESIADITFLTSGVWSATNGGSGTWKLQGAASDYQIYFNKTAGSNPDGSSVNTWISMASNVSWSFTKITVGTISCSGTLYIRQGTGANLASCAAFIEAAVE